MHCPLCDRHLDEQDADRHHLVPRQKGGAKGACVDLHRFCHTKIHSILTNSELARKYNTIEALKEHPDLATFIAWVKDKPSGFYMKNTMVNSRKKRR